MDDIADNDDEEDEKKETTILTGVSQRSDFVQQYEEQVEMELVDMEIETDLDNEITIINTNLNNNNNNNDSGSSLIVLEDIDTFEEVVDADFADIDLSRCIYYKSFNLGGQTYRKYDFVRIAIAEDDITATMCMCGAQIRAIYTYRDDPACVVYLRVAWLWRGDEMVDVSDEQKASCNVRGYDYVLSNSYQCDVLAESACDVMLFRGEGDVLFREEDPRLLLDVLYDVTVADRNHALRRHANDANPTTNKSNSSNSRDVSFVAFLEHFDGCFSGEICDNAFFQRYILPVWLDLVDVFNKNRLKWLQDNQYDFMFTKLSYNMVAREQRCYVCNSCYYMSPTDPNKYYYMTSKKNENRYYFVDSDCYIRICEIRDRILEPVYRTIQSYRSYRHSDPPIRRFFARELRQSLIQSLVASPASASVELLQ